MADDGNWLSMEGEGSGWGRFLLKLAGGVLAVGAITVIVLFIWSRATVAFGFLGAFLVIALVLIVLGWWYDRRRAHSASE